jgi:hypothetical protein
MTIFFMRILHHDLHLPGEYFTQCHISVFKNIYTCMFCKCKCKLFTPTWFYIACKTTIYDYMHIIDDNGS